MPAGNQQGYGMVEFSLASAALKCKTAMEAIENEMRPDSKRSGGKRKAEAPPAEPEPQSQVRGPGCPALSAIACLPLIVNLSMMS